MPVSLGELEWLDHHQLRETPTLPGACTLQSMVSAAVELVDRRNVTAVVLEDIRFHRFVRYAWNVEPNMRVFVEQVDDGFAAWMIGDVMMPNGAPNLKAQIFAEAHLRFYVNWKSAARS